ncbi:hypothetical protein M0Q28_05465 [Patescibacteria group bacterium]|nr:hypothetical protein [Patescibacteria group bacterium]
MISIPDTIVFQPHHAELTFDEETHTYRLKGGEILSSVTGILKAEGIQQYGPRNSDADFKMQVGTWVHQAIAWFEHGTLDESTLGEGIAAYLESYKKFVKITSFKSVVQLAEVPMWHNSWRFAGTPDLPGLIDGRFTVCDLKSGEKRSGDKVQVSAYGELIGNSVVGLDNVYPEGCIVYLDGDGGNPRIEHVSADNMYSLRSVFLAALQINRWKSSNA